MNVRLAGQLWPVVSPAFVKRRKNVPVEVQEVFGTYDGLICGLSRLISGAQVIF
jgi:hypothetical protein